MSLAARRAVSLALFIVAGVALCCGLSAGLLFPLAVDADGAEIERLQPASFAVVEDGEPGRTYMVEGVVAARSRATAGGFVAYTRSVQTGQRDDPWREVEEVLPELYVELPGGELRVVGDYRLGGALHAEERGDERLLGLRRGDAVLVVGALAEGREGPELEAELVAAGDRAAYLRDSRQASIFFRVFGWTLALGGGLLLAVGALLRRGRRAQPTSP